jgi:predicted outer membrane repeat protein
MTGTASSPILFKNNSAQEGGVIYIRQTPSVFIASSIFRQNYATFKGGIITVQNSDISIAKGTIILDTINV